MVGQDGPEASPLALSMGNCELGQHGRGGKVVRRRALAAERSAHPVEGGGIGAGVEREGRW